MGPRFDERGNVVGVDDGPVADVASMGPRFDERGNLQLIVVDYLQLMASMGPRFDERGNLDEGLRGRSLTGRFNGAALR